MKHPKKILTTGQLLSWLNENTSELLDNLIDLYPNVKHWENYNFAHSLEWKYECLERTEKLMQTSLSLKQFIPYRDGKVIEEIKLEEYEQRGYDDFTKGIITPFDTDEKLVKYRLKGEYQQACREILFDVKIKGYSNSDGETVFEYIGTKDNEIATKNLTTGWWQLHYKILEDLIIEIDLIGTEHFWSLIFKL